MTELLLDNNLSSKRLRPKDMSCTISRWFVKLYILSNSWNTCIIRVRCRRHITSRVESGSRAAVIGRPEKRVRRTADVEDPRRLDDKQLSVGGAGTTDDRPLILRRGVSVTAARQRPVHGEVIVHSRQPLVTRTIWQQQLTTLLSNSERLFFCIKTCGSVGEFRQLSWKSRGNWLKL